MAQPTTRESQKPLLSIKPFWERSTTEPPIQWKKWRIQVKLAILRKNITLDTLLEPKSSRVKLPTEPTYEVPIEDAREQTERERERERSKYGIVSSIYNGNSNAKKSQKQEYFVKNAHRGCATKNTYLFPISA